MVILAASVCTKHGKAIVSRQFVEMTKNRIESLLVAFPKLIEAGTQHTFVETDSVRYVYQPLERLFLVLITTKTSNILEDLETLRLFANVIPEYCKSIDEHEINESVFELIFAFDEIVSFGYRENVNLSQIRTFVEMDSHEEKVYQAVQQSKEREAKNRMREKAKELQKSKLESNRKSFASAGSLSTGFSSMSSNTNFAKSSTPILVTDNRQFDDVYSSSSSHSKPSSATAAAAQSAIKTPKSIMRLSAKNQEIDSFVDQVKTEDVKSVAPSTAASAFHVKIKVIEKVVLKMSRDGGLEQFELSGQMALHIAQEEFGRLQVHANLIGGSGRGGSDEQSRSNYQIQTHPNVDRELFQQSAIIGLKHATRSFPVNSEVSVLKWRLNQQSNSSDLVPLLINCWTTDNDDSSCDVILEYNLNWTKMELRNVEITFQLPENSKSVVSNCEVGVYEVLRKTAFVWKIDTISSRENSTSSLELSVTRCRGNDLFPVTVAFESDQLYTTVNVTKAVRLDDPNAAAVRFDLQTEFTAAKYEVV